MLDGEPVPFRVKDHPDVKDLGQKYGYEPKEIGTQVRRAQKGKPTKLPPELKELVKEKGII